MSKIKKDGEQYIWWCPGCKGPHIFTDSWDFDGDFEQPSIHPSILTRGVKRCHVFIKGGQIEYLDDCDHELAGQKVPLPNLPRGV